MLKDKKRFLYMFVLGIGIYFLLKIFVYIDVEDHPPIYDFMVTIFITILIWEGNLRIDHWMNQRYNWLSDTKKRLIIHLFAALIFSAITLYSILYLYDTYFCELTEEHNKLMGLSFIIGLFISFITLSIEVSGQLLKGWKTSLIEVEKYKTASAQAQLQNLKDQVNPHFLFNNLSVLSSLVYKDQDKAADFINQLSKVYRYLLDNKTNELVSLSEELKFIDSYIYLLQIRFDKNIQFNMKIDEIKLKCMIPPMSVQMLLENAIKHNEVSSQFPLSISMKTLDHSLEVSNNFQPRMHIEPSSKSGLQNIKDRYQYFTEQEVEIINENNNFIVRIPLLEKL